MAKWNAKRRATRTPEQKAAYRQYLREWRAKKQTKISKIREEEYQRTYHTVYSKKKQEAKRQYHRMNADSIATTDPLYLLMQAEETPEFRVVLEEGR